jgi:hypothetical protein
MSLERASRGRSRREGAPEVELQEFKRSVERAGRCMLVATHAPKARKGDAQAGVCVGAVEPMSTMDGRAATMAGQALRSVSALLQARSLEIDGPVFERVLSNFVPGTRPRLRCTLGALAPWISTKTAAANRKKEGKRGAAFFSRDDWAKLSTGSALREPSDKRAGGLGNHRTVEAAAHAPGPAGAPGRIE